MTESTLLAEIRLALGLLPGTVFWRNNTGAVELPHRHVHFGLAVGSADLVGVVDGRFCALEVKTSTGRVRAEQITWLEVVRKAGGFACVVRSVDEAVAAVERCREGTRA